MSDLRGKFIVFDGGEGCGKSTQVQLLRDKLAAMRLEIVVVRDPGTTHVGELIREILLNPLHVDMSMRCEMLLYMAARAQMMAESIKPAIESGKVVLCDRFVSSTLAYQLGGDGLSEDDIRSVAEIALAGRWPDCVIVFDMPVERSIGRVKRAKDRIELRPREYHEQVRRRYLAQAKSDPARYRLIDADRAPEAVHEDVWRAIQSM
jgi:dTMP kinase